MSTCQGAGPVPVPAPNAITGVKRSSASSPDEKSGKESGAAAAPAVPGVTLDQPKEKRVKIPNESDVACLRQHILKSYECMICFKATAAPIFSCPKNIGHVVCVGCLCQSSLQTVYPKITHNATGIVEFRLNLQHSDASDSAHRHIDLCPQRCQRKEIDEKNDQQPYIREWAGRFLIGQPWLDHNPYKQEHYSKLGYECIVSGLDDVLRESYTCPWCAHYGPWSSSNTIDFFHHVFLCPHRRFSCMETTPVGSMVTAHRSATIRNTCAGFSWGAQLKKPGDTIGGAKRLPNHHELAAQAFVEGILDRSHLDCCLVKTTCGSCGRCSDFANLKRHAEAVRNANIFRKEYSIQKELLSKLGSEISKHEKYGTCRAEFLNWMKLLTDEFQAKVNLINKTSASASAGASSRPVTGNRSATRVNSSNDNKDFRDLMDFARSFAAAVDAGGAGTGTAGTAGTTRVSVASISSPSSSPASDTLNRQQEKQAENGKHGEDDDDDNDNDSGAEMEEGREEGRDEKQQQENKRIEFKDENFEETESDDEPFVPRASLRRRGSLRTAAVQRARLRTRLGRVPPVTPVTQVTTSRSVTVPNPAPLREISLTNPNTISQTANAVPSSGISQPP